MELRVFQWGDGEYPTHWLIGDFEAGVVVCTLIDKDLAYVMAVAPAMLEALEEMIELVKDVKWRVNGDDSYIAHKVQKAETIMKKARGE